MKKATFILMSLILFMAMFTINISAATSSDVILFEKKEIENLDELYNRAVNGISDVDEEGHFLQENNLQNFKTNSDGFVNTEKYLTTQKLKTIENSNGEIVEYFATTIFQDVSVENMEGLEPVDGEPTFTINGSKSEDTKGPSLSVRSYSTIYWENKQNGNVTMYRLTKVTGGWTILDSQVSITSKRVEYGQSSTLGNDDTLTKYPTGSTFSYTTPSDWGFQQSGVMGVTTYATLKRGTSTWEQKLINNKSYYY